MSDDVIKVERFTGKIEAAGSTLTGSTFLRVKMDGASFDDVNLAAAKLRAVNLEGASFADVKLERASLTNVNFSGATLKGVNLARTRFSECDLRNVALDQCNTDGMTLDGVSIAEMRAAWKAAKQDGKDAAVD